MDLDETLTQLRKLAEKDPEVRQKLLSTENSENPVSAFCAEARTLGFELYEMDLVMAGEEYYAAMRRSTNGGGENSPLLQGEDDYYEMFMAQLKDI